MKNEKFTKRLVLKKETITDLDTTRLNDVKGGTGPTVGITCMQWPSDCECPTAMCEEFRTQKCN